jgi:hypothetical protein
MTDRHQYSFHPSFDGLFQFALHGDYCSLHIFLTSLHFFLIGFHFSPQPYLMGPCPMMTGIHPGSHFLSVGSHGGIHLFLPNLTLSQQVFHHLFQFVV